MNISPTNQRFGNTGLAVTKVIEKPPQDTPKVLLLTDHPKVKKEFTPQVSGCN